MLREPGTSQATKPSNEGLGCDPAEVRRTARRHLGRFSAAQAFREIRLVARELRPGEDIRLMTEAVVHGEGLVGKGRLAVVTDHRLLIVQKGLLSGREQVIDIPWPWIRAFQVDGLTSLRMDLLEVKIATPEREIRLTLAGSQEANAELIDNMRRSGADGMPPGPPAGELRDHVEEAHHFATGRGPGTAALPTSPGSRLNVAWQQDPRRYAVMDGGTECAFLMLTRAGWPAHAVTATRTCDLSVTRRRTGWLGVVTERTSRRAIAGYYPGWRSGGVLTFEDHQVDIRLRRFAGRAVIRGETGVIARVQNMRYGKVAGTDGEVPVEMHLDLGAYARDAPDLDLVLVLAIWVIVLETGIAPQIAGVQA